MTDTENMPTLDEVLDQFFYASNAPSKALLHDLMEKYPEYGEELSGFAFHWVVTEPTDDSQLVRGEVPEESLISVRSKVFNALYESGEKASSSNENRKEGTIVSLRDASTELKQIKGRKALKLVSSKAKLGYHTELLGKVLSGLIIDPPTVVMRGIAGHIDVPMELVAQCFASGNQQGGMRHFSAKNKPSATKQETWEDAVNHLTVSEEEKERLLNLAQQIPNP